MARARDVTVRSESGTEHVVLQVNVEDRIPVTEQRRVLVRFELETGEQVQHVDDDTFVLTTTGEKFVRYQP